MKRTNTVTADNEGVSRITEMTRELLKKYKLKKDHVSKIVLTVEEAAGLMAAHSREGSMISVCFRFFMGVVTIELSAEGEQFNFTNMMNKDLLFSDEVGQDAQDMIRGVVLKSLADDLKYRHRKGENRISFTILRSPRAFLYQTMGAMVLAILVGLILTMLGADWLNDTLDTYILTPIKTMYVNALKMIVAPVVFFSIASCIVQFSNMTELGRIGGRIIIFYIITTIIAVTVGLTMFYVFKPGSTIPAGGDVGSVESVASQTMDVSIKDTIVSIVPSNLIKPFLDSNMLQLIFLAVISGIAAGLVGKYSDMVKSLFETFNELFLKITTLIINFMPLAVFCSICSMMLSVGFSTILSVLGMLATFLVGLLCMMCVYCIILAVVGRINPLCFVKKYAPSMLQVFSMGSSNAAIPVNMQACDNMGVDKKVYCLSLPLGATLNMDGHCVYMAVFTLALAKTYGVTITGSALTAIIISIIVLSMGAPGIPGSGLICLSTLLTQVGVPIEAVGLVMGIDSFVGMFRCMSNSAGDVAISILVAKLENMLDMGKYNNVSVD